MNEKQLRALVKALLDEYQVYQITGNRSDQFPQISTEPVNDLDLMQFLNEFIIDAEPPKKSDGKQP